MRIIRVYPSHPCISVFASCSISEESELKMTNRAAPFFLSSYGARLLFFGGKGGVGKTTCATATALHLARAMPDSPLLLVSTDPAHSLVDSLASATVPPNMTVLELDPQQALADFKAAHGWKLRKIARHGTFLDDDDIQKFLDLSLPGLDELMAFLEITRQVEEDAGQCIVVDTAPTGHTLRLLAIPALISKWLRALDALIAKHRYMKKLFSGAYRRDEVDFFLESLTASIKNMKKLLSDPDRCRFVPVMLAEPLSVSETVTLIRDLEHLEVPVSEIVVNKLYPSNSCQVCTEGRRRQLQELKKLLAQNRLSRYSFWGMPFHPREVRGLVSLGKFWRLLTNLTETSLAPPHRLAQISQRVEVVNQAPLPEASLLIFAGKGGVGKTSLACATALRLASEPQKRKILLVSTDPAHSLSTCLAVPIGPNLTRVTSGLTAFETDAQAEFQGLKREYAEEVEQFLGAMINRDRLDLVFDRQVIERLLDLSPPGLDEVMALARVMEMITQERFDLLVLDSAPTGHLLRLLEMPEVMDQWLKAIFELLLKYKHILRMPKLSRRLIDISRHLKRLRVMLRDPAGTALYAVSIPTEMALEETKDLLAACERMGISVPALFLNQATPAGQCPFCSALHREESKVREKYRQAFTNRHQTLAYRCGELSGIERLGELGAELYQTLDRKRRADDL
jgi:arsenite/tail-anchored protein-transporting ATPase